MSTSPTEDTGDVFRDQLTRDRWEHEVATPGLAGRMMAEVIGTFALVIIGVGTALYALPGGNGSLAIGLAFGIALVAVIVAVATVSGAHVNPAVTVGAWMAGRFPAKDVAPYLVAQVVGGVAAGYTLFAVAGTQPDTDDAGAALSAVANGFGEHSPLGFPLAVVLATEVIATGLLMAVILAATSARAPRMHAPIAIGLVYAALVMWAIPFSNAALNPARATATAVVADTWALQQLWALWVAPIVGAALVGFLFRVFGPDEDFDATHPTEDRDQGITAA